MFSRNRSISLYYILIYIINDFLSFNTNNIIFENNLKMNITISNVTIPKTKSNIFFILLFDVKTDFTKILLFYTKIEFLKILKIHCRQSKRLSNFPYLFFLLLIIA